MFGVQPGSVSGLTRPPTVWALGTVYSTDQQVVNSNGDLFISKSGHTSTALDEPGIGANTLTYWNPATYGLTLAQNQALNNATTLDGTHPPLVKGTDTAADVSSTNKLQSTNELNATYLRRLPQEYAASDIIRNKTVSVAADRQKTLVPAMRIDIDGTTYYVDDPFDMSVASASNWDSVATIDYTVALNRRAIPIYKYACKPSSGMICDIMYSPNASYPSGYTGDTSRKIGALTTMAIDIGTIASHPFTGYLGGDVHKTSIKCLKNRPADKAFGEGMVWLGHPDLTYQIPDLWVDMYLPSGTGTNTASTFGATISDTRTWLNFVDDLAAVGKRLLWDAEFQVAAYGSPEQVNIYGSLDPVLTGLIRTYGLTTGAGLNDFSISTTTWVISSYAQEYVFEIDATGTPDTFKWRKRYPGGTWGSYTTGVAITGGFQDIEDGLQVKWLATTGHTIANVWSVYCMDAPLSTAAVPMISHAGCWAMTGNLWQWLMDQGYRFDGASSHTHTVTGAPGVTGAPSGDVAPAFGYYALPDSRGQLFRQGTYGDVKLLAGGQWNFASLCGSRSRGAYGSRWDANSYIGARGCARTKVNL